MLNTIINSLASLKNSALKLVIATASSYLRAAQATPAKPMPWEKKTKNYAFTDPITFIKDGDIIENCNLAQINPRTKILWGKKRLTFYRCNMVNCTLPKDVMINPTEEQLKNRKDEWVVYGGNIAQIDYTDRENPVLVAQKDISKTDMVVGGQP